MELTCQEVRDPAPTLLMRNFGTFTKQRRQLLKMQSTLTKGPGLEQLGHNRPHRESSPNHHQSGTISDGGPWCRKLVVPLHTVSRQGVRKHSPHSTCQKTQFSTFAAPTEFRSCVSKHHLRAMKIDITFFYKKSRKEDAVHSMSLKSIYNMSPIRNDRGRVPHFFVKAFFDLSNGQKNSKCLNLRWKCRNCPKRPSDDIFEESVFFAPLQTLVAPP